jgi:hypothetical protein
MTMYPKVHILAGATLRLSGVEVKGTPNATMAHHILLVPFHQKGNLRSTKGPLRVVAEPVQAWVKLHNLNGDSQVHCTKVTSLRQASQQLEALNYTATKATWPHKVTKDTKAATHHKILQDVTKGYNMPQNTTKPLRLQDATKGYKATKTTTPSRVSRTQEETLTNSHETESS